MGFAQTLIVLVAIAAFAVSLQVSVAGAFAAVRPALAIEAVPADARARARLADQLAAVAGEGQVAVARELAIEALRRDLTQSPAMRALAATVPPGPTAGNRELALMVQAQRVAKRDVATQMWMVEHHRRRGDSAAVVRHLDLALRSSETARPSIFPLLDAAAADPRTASLLLERLASRPNWAPAYALFAVRNGMNLEFGARVARLLLDPRAPVGKAQYFMLLQRLSDVGNHQLAWSIYMDPALRLRVAAGGNLRNGGFEEAEDTSRFDWSYSEQADLSSAKERLAGRGTVLRVTAAERSGEVARQIVRLDPGRHRLTARMGDLPAGVLARPQVRVACAPGGPGSPVLLNLRPGGSAAREKSLAGSFVVPADCAFQLISIQVAAGSGTDGPGPWIDDITLG